MNQFIAQTPKNDRISARRGIDETGLLRCQPYVARSRHVNQASWADVRLSNVKALAVLKVFALVAVAILHVTPAWAVPMAMTDARYLILFEQHCGSCHGMTSTAPRAPNREALVAFSPERVYDALTTGPMVAHSSDLTDDEKRGIAMNVTGRPFGTGAARTAQAMPNRCADHASRAGSSPRSEWNGSNADPTTNARFQSADAAGLTANQVSRLVLKWSFGLPDSGAVRGQPIVVDGRVFLGSDNGMVYALNAKTGCVYWSFEVGKPVVTAVSVGPVSGSSGREAVYFGDFGANVYALDVATGEQLWKVDVDDHPMAKITGSPVLEPSGGRLYVPVGSWEEGISASNPTYECCTSQGSVVAIDTANGRQIWKSYTIPERPHPVRKNAAGIQLYGPSGAGIWSAPTLDLKRRAVYVGTANGYINVPDQGSSDAVIAFNLDTGERLWSTQLLAGDQNCKYFGMPDAIARIDCPGHIQGPNDDVSGSPILHTLPDGRQILIAGQESGRITALDPDHKGAVLWVAQAGDAMSGQGSGMGPAADENLYYRPLELPGKSGGMAALRPETGERVWYTTHPKPMNCADPDAASCSSGVFGAATVIPGVVFAGGRDGMFRAYSTRDGKVLWEYNTMRVFETDNEVPAKGGSIGAQGPAIVGGMLYIGSGYSVIDSVSGNVLLAFGVE